MSDRDTQDIAELTEGAAAQGAFGVDMRAILDTWSSVFQQALEQPSAAFAATRKLNAELLRVWAGTSSADLGGDPRFADPAWQDNPLYRRLGQSYQAWAESLDEWLRLSGFTGIEAQRARFVLDAARDVMAPVNNLLGNPAALKRAKETRGASVLRGLRNFVDDVQHNHGYPAVADRTAFELGRDVATTEGAVVFRNDLLELIQYQPTTETVHGTPFLYVFSQVNRFYLGDLTPDRSLFARMLDAGIPVYAISWRNPTLEHRNWDLNSYAGGVIDAIRVVRAVSGRKKVHLMGLCAGGIVASAAAGVLKKQDRNWVKTLSLVVSVLDNRPGESEFGLFVTERSVEAQKAMVRGKGVFSERDIFEMFAMLRIEDNVMSFLRSNYLMGEAPLQHPLLFWSMDYTRVPAEMQCDFLDLGQNNRLARGKARILGKKVDLSQIDYPVYIAAGVTDHITPWQPCYRSTQLFGGEVTFVLTNQNHTQSISARADNPHLRHWVPAELPEDPEAAMATASELNGSWSNHWIEWLLARGARKQRPAPTRPGSKKYPALDAAPGLYVRES